MRGKGSPTDPPQMDDQTQRDTHKSHPADWRWGEHNSPYAAVYVGVSEGWYKAPPCEPVWEEEYETKVVYFIHAPDAGRVKIGRSRHPLKRLSDLQVANHERLELVGVLPHASEDELHTRFAGRRIRGEWFEDSILDEIDFEE